MTVADWFYSADDYSRQLVAAKQSLDCLVSWLLIGPTADTVQ